MPSHPLRSYFTLDEFLTAVLGADYSKAHRHYRFWMAKWSTWKTKNPVLPYRVKYAFCSGKVAKLDHKLGRWKTSLTKWKKEIWD